MLLFCYPPCKKVVLQMLNVAIGLLQLYLFSYFHTADSTTHLFWNIIDLITNNENRYTYIYLISDWDVTSNSIQVWNHMINPDFRSCDWIGTSLVLILFLFLTFCLCLIALSLFALLTPVSCVANLIPVKIFACLHPVCLDSCIWVPVNCKVYICLNFLVTS